MGREGKGEIREGDYNSHGFMGLRFSQAGLGEICHMARWEIFFFFRNYRLPLCSKLSSLNWPLPCHFLQEALLDLLACRTCLCRGQLSHRPAWLLKAELKKRSSSKVSL